MTWRGKGKKQQKTAKRFQVVGVPSKRPPKTGGGQVGERIKMNVTAIIVTPTHWQPHVAHANERVCVCTCVHACVCAFNRLRTSLNTNCAKIMLKNKYKRGITQQANK